jgi:hypothetical protein
MTPMPASQVLDNYFLEARTRLLDLAAILDRIDRGIGADRLVDYRLERIASAIKLLGQQSENRTESIQEVFSQPYDSHWKLPSVSKTA